LVEGATGMTLHRDEEGRRRSAAPGGGAPPPGDYEAVWQAMTDVAPHWFPLEPEAPPGERAKRLALRLLVRTDDAGGVETVLPQGRLLREQDLFFVFEEEVRPAGSVADLCSGRRVASGLGAARQRADCASIPLKLCSPPEVEISEAV
jgi:hypothetical protein